MAITGGDAIRVALEASEIHDLIAQANEISLNIVDRPDLHERDFLERFVNVLLGETAEFMVIKWLQSNGKYARSGVDKKSGAPDAGYDLIVRKKGTGEEIQCSVKSSLAAKFGLEKIISDFTLATTRSEVRAVNIQVYFWLEIDRTPRLTLPASDRAAIVGWFAQKDLTGENFSRYKTERRESPAAKLSEARSMRSLLDFVE